MKRRHALLLHPVFLLSLGTLLLNDHYLKYAHPSWLTGKLSDFSGLLVLSFVAVWFLEQWFYSRKSLVLIHVACGAAFALWKLVPANVWISDLLNMFTLPGVTKTPDTTDLVALFVLPLSCHVLTTRATSSITYPIFQRLAVCGVLAVSLFAIVATSLPRTHYTLHSDETILINTGIERALWIIEEALYTTGIDVMQRHQRENGEFELTYEISNRVGPELADARQLQGFVRFTIDTGARACIVNTIHIWGYVRGVPYEKDPFLDAICRDYILKSIREALEKE